jgi:4-hydroxybenzoate polyprenyltransferase
VESALYVTRHSPLNLFQIPKWLVQGKATLKQQLAGHSEFDPQFLPYNPSILSLIENARKQGQPVVLATASHQTIAHHIANHLGCFDEVIASNGEVNLSGKHKAEALCERFGLHGFDYAGNSNDDLPVWQNARKAIVVNASSSTLARAELEGNVSQNIPGNRTSLKHWLRAIRPHQWSKNALLLLPLMASHHFNQGADIALALIGILLFSLCASSAYLLNDLLDLPDDRQHSSKRNRPLAAGQIQALPAAVLSVLLAIIPLASALFWLPTAFSLTLVSYYTLTLAYSFWLKRQMALDVITLSMLYTLRIIAGAFVIQVPLTFWILTFSMFLFLSLALMKRFTELRQAREKGQTSKAGGRGYYPDDLEMVASMGVSSGFLSVLILALYIQDQTTTLAYHHPQILWLACPVMLFWITRVWFLTHRGEMQDDPVLFAVKDKTSLVTVLLMLLIFGAGL